MENSPVRSLWRNALSLSISAEALDNQYNNDVRLQAMANLTFQQEQPPSFLNSKNICQPTWQSRYHPQRV